MTTLTIDAKLFTDALRRVLPHAEKPNSGTPILENIRFTVRGSWLVIQATDRYTVGESRVPLSEVDAMAELDVIADAARVKALVPALRRDALVMLTDDEDEVTLSGAYVTPLDVHRVRDWPAVGRLWPAELGEDVQGPLSLSVATLKKLAALPQTTAERRDESPTFHSVKPGGPVVVLFGEDTRVLAMPVRANVERARERFNGWHPAA